MKHWTYLKTVAAQQKNSWFMLGCLRMKEIKHSSYYVTSFLYVEGPADIRIPNFIPSTAFHPLHSDPLY